MRLPDKLGRAEKVPFFLEQRGEVAGCNAQKIGRFGKASLQGVQKIQQKRRHVPESKIFSPDLNSFAARAVFAAWNENALADMGRNFTGKVHRSAKLAGDVHSQPAHGHDFIFRLRA